MEYRLPIIKENIIYFELFMTIYSIPNIILPLIAGILVDKYDARRCMIVYTLILFVGQTIVAIGSAGDNPSYWTMIAGRFIFALGGE